MVRNGMVDAVRVWEDRCYTVGQLQCVKVRCGTVFTVRCGEYVSSTMRHGKGTIRCGKLERYDAIRLVQYM